MCLRSKLDSSVLRGFNGLAGQYEGPQTSHTVDEAVFQMLAEAASIAGAGDIFEE